MAKKRRVGDTVKIRGDYQAKALVSSNAVQRFWHTSKLRYIQRLLPATQNDVILDIGCGSGVISDFLGKSGAQVFGVDGSPDAIAFAQKNYAKKNVTFIEGLVDEKFSISRKFDKMYCLELIEHIYFDQGKILLEQCYKNLKPGGTLFLTTPNYRSTWPLIEKILDTLSLVPHLDEDQHVAHYTPQRLKKMCEEGGFEVSYLGTMCGLAPWVAPLHWKFAEVVDETEYSARSMFGSVIVTVIRKPYRK